MKYEVTLYYVKQFYVDVEAEDRDEAIAIAKQKVKHGEENPDDLYLDDWHVREDPKDYGDWDGTGYFG